LKIAHRILFRELFIASLGTRFPIPTITHWPLVVERCPCECMPIGHGLIEGNVEFVLKAGDGHFPRA